MAGATHRIRPLIIVFLLGLLALGSVAAAPAKEPVVLRDVTYATRDGQPLRMDAYLPGTWATGRPAIVIVHGGGWAGGKRQDHEATGLRFARHGWVAVSVDYRLAPGGDVRDQITDVRDAIRFVRGRAANIGVDPAKIAVVGDSAGGHLAALAGAVGRGATDVDARVAAVVAWSGMYDLPALSGLVGTPAEWLTGAAEQVVGCPIVSLDPACVGAWWVGSPVNLADATDPPVLLVHGRDEFVPVAQVGLYEDRLRSVGVPHTTRILPTTAHGKHLIVPTWDATLYFLDQQLNH